MLVRQRNEVSRVWVQDHKDSVKVKGHINAPLTTGQSIRRCNIRCSEGIVASAAWKWTMKNV